MKTIRIWFTDFWESFSINDVNNIKNKINDFYQLLEKKYNIIFDDKNPDYLFFSVYGNTHLNYKHSIKIFFTGECCSPNFNECDYAIGFDYISFGDRYLRCPIYLLNWARYKLATKIKCNKNKFCSFVVSNDFCASNMRIDIFRVLSKYKQVDSGGKLFNNVGGRIKDKIDFIKDYKFNICFENQSYKGYITEKIVDAFYAGCIPIYWGAPDIGEWFNEKAFINCNKFKDFNEVVNKVKEIDNNESLRLKMLNEPILARPIEYKLEEFLYNIFDQNIEKTRRRPKFNMAKALQESSKSKNVDKLLPKIKSFFRKKIING